MTAMSALFAEHALLPQGWARNVALNWNADGILTEVRPDARPDASTEAAAGPVLPGMPNLHSHAFQRAMAGLAERHAGEENDFWSWRGVMYDFALRVGPDALEAIATHLYIEMLKAGYTSVCEFHYLHHDPQGRPYSNPAELCERIVAAAHTAGIGLTLLPVLYQHGGFAREPLPEQRRFIVSPEAVLDMLARLRHAHPEHARLRYGAAPHSLRAVSPAALLRLLQGLHADRPDAPVHIHVAEQAGEVADALTALGASPVAWLLDHCAVDARWCLVHATHARAGELARVARTGATVGLCPTTEANLGDGIFDAPAYFAASGAWGIGSDSHISVNVAEELRWLEYAQRLVHRRRNLLAGEGTQDLAEHLYLGALSGGARASARMVAGLAVGQCADLVVLSADTANGCMDAPDKALSSWVFGNHPGAALRDVMAGGRWLVRAGRHSSEEAALRDYIRARDALISGNAPDQR